MDQGMETAPGHKEASPWNFSRPEGIFLHIPEGISVLILDVNPHYRHKYLSITLSTKEEAFL